MTSADTAFRRYRTDGSHEAFREVVAVHLPMVYGTALRLGQGNAAEAEDVSQMVFADRARKASALREDAAVGAWLHRHTCFLMKNAIRSDVRRRNREAAAAMDLHADRTGSPSTGEQWEEIEGSVDRCLESMREADRRILVLRFFEGRALRDVGESLGIGDDAAQKRVSRALDRLRALLITGRRGALSSVSLAAAMSARVRAEVPAGVAASLARSALQLAGARSGSLVASGGSAAVTAAWSGVAATAALGAWLFWPYWPAAEAGEAGRGSLPDGTLAKRADAMRGNPGSDFAKAGNGAAAGNDDREAGSVVARTSMAGGKSAKSMKEKTPEEQEKEAASKASTFGKWMVAYALDHGGSFPPDLSALFSGVKYGFPVDKAGEWLSPVIEYRGRKLTVSDPGSLVLLRYRIGENKDREVRLLVTCAVQVCAVTDPIPEHEEMQQPAAGPAAIPARPVPPKR